MTTTITENMPVQITPHNMTLSPELIAKVEKEIGTLKTAAVDAVKAEVVLHLNHRKAEGDIFKVSALLTLPSGDIVENATNTNLNKAITKVGRRLARRLL